MTTTLEKKKKKVTKKKKLCFQNVKGDPRKKKLRKVV